LAITPAIDFFRAKFGADSAEHKRAIQWWSEEREFGAFIGEITRDLIELYQSEISRQDKLRLREEVFTRSRAEWARRIADRPLHRFRGFSQQALNNAVLMHYVVYLKDLDLFELLYRSAGENLPKTIELLQQAAAKGGDPFDAVRQLTQTHSPLN
jgi:predicted aminopeptidase